ncbi:MAG: cupredoxin domain-containing protein [Gaiellales bacterium]
MKKLVPLCAALAAVGAIALPVSSAGAGTGFTIKEKQWSLSKPPSLKHGVVYTVDVKNIGTFAHDLLIDGKGVSDRGIHNAHPIAPGTSASFTVKFPSAGTYRFYCAIKGHAAQGMQMNVKVT